MTTNQGVPPIPGLKVAGPDDLKGLLLMQVVMGFDWTSYWNLRVLEAVRQNSKRRLSHLKFVPDVENGLVYILPALKGEYGAIALDYTGPETGAELSLYVPLLRFDLDREEGRQRIFQVEPHTVGSGATYMALNILTSTSVPVKARSSKAPKESPAAQTAASGTDSQEDPT